MREIKFRGKNADGKWLYGNLVKYRPDNYSILGIEEISITPIDFIALSIVHNLVDENTIGQFSGKYDKHKKEIYEGDIVLQVGYNNKLVPMLVRFENGAFIVGYHKGSSTRNTPMLLSSKCEVIGNQYDNPELLEELK